MKISDLVIGLFFLVFGLGILGYGISLPPMPGQRYGAGLFPMLLGIGFAGFGAQLAHQGWKARSGAGAPLIALDDWVRTPRLLINVLLVLGMVIVYVTLSEHIGFIVLSLAMLLFLFWWFGIPLLRSVAIAVVTTAFIHIGFVKFLRVPLPRGILSAIVW